MTILEMIKEYESGCTCEECTKALIVSIKKQAIRDDAIAKARAIFSHYSNVLKWSLMTGLPIKQFNIDKLINEAKK